MRCAGTPGIRLVLCGLLWLTVLPAQAAPWTFSALARSARSGVVNISTTQAVRPARDADRSGDAPGPFPAPTPGAPGPGGTAPVHSLGSGFIISANGYIITDYHVVKGAQQIRVRLTDRREFQAHLVGGDRRSDIALLKIDATRLPTVRIGRSSDLKVGQWVLAIGSPFGFDYSVTTGIVSALNRSLPRQDYVPFIQTDVAINPGNSGGPLFNLKGEVVGVNARIFSDSGGYQGVSFAVPIEVAMSVAAQLRATGHVARGWLGVEIQDLDEGLAQSFGLSRPVGALVTRVLPDTPAARAGLRVGDVIVAYDGHEVVDSGSLPPMVGLTRIGSDVPVTVVRDGKPLVVRAHIAALPAHPQPTAVRPAADGVRAPELGISVIALPDSLRHAGDGSGRGVLVAAVGPGPARRAGIRRGDVLLMLNGVRIKGPEQFGRVSAALPHGGTVPVLVKRRRGPLFLPLRIPARGGPHREPPASAAGGG